MSGLWQVAQDTFRFPLKRGSKKNFSPSALALGSSANAFDGSFGKGGRDPIQRERRTIISPSLHEAAVPVSTAAAKAAAAPYSTEAMSMKHVVTKVPTGYGCAFMIRLACY
jgi:hypothetical protein